jgi:hypothetical protein
MFDTEKLLEKELCLEAYFTLSHKAIALDKDISGSKRRKVFKGVSSQDDFAHFVLIGHLGKHINGNEHSAITSSEILNAAFEIIHKAKNLITFKAVLVECKDDEKLVSLYSNYGFSFLQKDSYMQLIKRA